MYRKIILFIAICFYFLSISISSSHVSTVSAQDNNQAEFEYKEEIMEGVVTKILDEMKMIPAGTSEIQEYQKLEIKITKGSQKNSSIVIETSNAPISQSNKYKVGDNLVINHGKTIDGKDLYYISDYVRRDSLIRLFILFVLLTVFVAKWQGLSSMIGMGISFAVIFKFILPNIYSGKDPVLFAILGSMIIIPVTFFLSHGLNRKTFIAIAGTLFSLVITGMLASFFVELARLTGFASEEASFLQSQKMGAINIKGLLLAGIIISALGVLDDITISQSAIVSQLKETNPELNPNELYKKAMQVGKDHIASMVNTIILVYTGSALPLLLLFIDSPYSFSDIINYEIIADEIVRTLVGSIGLILAVPITTAIASIHTSSKSK